MNKIELSTRCYEKTIRTEKEYDEVWNWLLDPGESISFIYDAYSSNVEHRGARYAVDIDLLAHLDWMSLVIQLTRRSPYTEPKEAMEEFLEKIDSSYSDIVKQSYIAVACELLEECKNV